MAPCLLLLVQKSKEKNVGIPICEGAATSKSPWDEPGKLFLRGLRFHMVLMNIFY